MNKLKNFVNRSLCEYHSIFPNVASVLGHLFFTIGNGYNIDPITGMFAEVKWDKNTDKNTYSLLSDWPELNEKGWKKLISKCHNKETEFIDQLYIRYKEDPSLSSQRDYHIRLTDAKAKYKPVNVEDFSFSEDELYQQLRAMDSNNKMKAHTRKIYDSFLRPYPLSTQYSDIYNLNENSPPWLAQIAINLTKAWVKFLDGEIEYEHVYTEEPTPLIGQQFIGSVHDYANMKWTVKHRDMLVELLPKLQKLHDSHFNFKAHDKVVVIARDPWWTYAGAAEPMPGMMGTIITMKSFESPPAGKVAVSFSEQTLGYQKSDKGNITLFVNPSILEKRS